MRTARQTAILLALVLKRSGQTRARLSSKTVKLLARRDHLRSAFVVNLVAELAEYGWLLSETSIGGFGAIQFKALEGAKAVTAEQFLTELERRALSQGNVTPEDFEPEIKLHEEDTLNFE